MGESEEKDRTDERMERLHRVVLLLSAVVMALLIATMTGKSLERPASLRKHTGTSNEPLFINNLLGVPSEAWLDPTPAVLKSSRQRLFLDGAAQAARARVDPELIRDAFVLGPYAARGWPLVSKTAHVTVVVNLKRRWDEFPDGILYIDATDQGGDPDCPLGLLGNCVFYFALILMLILGLRTLASK